MRSDRFSVKERAALLALLTAPRGFSNLELERRVGFRLDGKERRRLNELKLVESHKDGRTYVHELSDAGWRWCRDEFIGEPGPRPGSMERTLYALLPFVRRHLEDHKESLADLFASGTDVTPEQDVESSIRAGYRALTSDAGAFIKLSDLRQKLADVSRTDLDTALDRMYRAQLINLIPQSNRRELTDADRESALRIGGEDKHLVSIEPR
jgi:hypothetical protein